MRENALRYFSEPTVLLETLCIAQNVRRRMALFQSRFQQVCTMCEKTILTDLARKRIKRDGDKMLH